MTPAEQHRARTAALARASGREPHIDDWSPQPAQEGFLRCGAFEVLFGGAAGGGKSDALLAWLVGGVGRGYGRAYQALGLRRTFPELEKSLVRRAYELYPRLGGKGREGGARWDFPGGETILLEHCEHEKEVTRYQGAAFVRVAFDELTTFTEYQYRYLFSRVRSAVEIPHKGVRAGSNPGGPGHEWVRKRFLPWVSRKAERPARAGEVRWYAPKGDNEVETAPRAPGARSRSFIPSKLDDNLLLTESDPEYRDALMALPRLERERLLGGDWDAQPASKDYWDRTRVQVLRVAPSREEVVRRCRWWDFAASTRPGGDFIAGARCSWTEGGLFVIEHVAHFQGAPDALYARFGACGESDKLFDPDCIQGIPEDPGAAGKLVVADFLRRFSSLTIKAVRPSGDKAQRFMPVSSRALAGRVAVVDDGSWDVAGLHDELEALWSGAHDDRADALSDAYAEVSQESATIITVRSRR